MKVLWKLLKMNSSGIEYDPNPSPVIELELTVSNVDRVLDEVRPYLIADGGNVAVVSVDSTSRSITLSLQGACGSCQSSTTTMKMGIERVLKENFRALGEIIAVNGVAVTSDSIPLLTEAEVNEVLSKVLPAVKAMKGSVIVKESLVPKMVTPFALGVSLRGSIIFPNGLKVELLALVDSANALIIDPTSLDIFLVDLSGNRYSCRAASIGFNSERLNAWLETRGVHLASTLPNLLINQSHIFNMTSDRERDSLVCLALLSSCLAENLGMHRLTSGNYSLEM
eukprot:gene18971-19313_t